MQNYKTVEEKAVELDVSPRHIQYLCKNGKIEGAVKKAGVWFIPDDSLVPIRNTKYDDQRFEFVDTKKKIFESAIELFMLNGFEGVSIKDIADQVGISQGSIYNHFKSKQEILDTIYGFYCYHNVMDRKKIEEIEPVLHNGSLLDIIHCLLYEYKYLELMSNTIKILFQRISIDQRAREIVNQMIVKEGVQFVEAVFNRAIEIGRLAPFDVHLMAVLVNSLRLYKLFVWIVDPSPEIMKKIEEDEEKQYKNASTLLTDLKPPAENGTGHTE